jgi:TolA-binding protein
MTFAFDLTVTLSLLFSVATFAFAYFRTRRVDVNERFEKAESRIETLAAKQAVLEREIAAAPGREELHRLELHLVEMAGDMKALASSVKGQNDILKRLESVVTRHEDHLLAGGKR